MKLFKQKHHHQFLTLLLLMVCLAIQETSRAVARPLPLSSQERYGKTFASLGVVCKCCDGAEGGGEESCTASWEGSCSKLHCLPWKLRFTVPLVPGSGGTDLVPGPGAGMYPSRGDLGGGSMLVGPNDPRFFGGGTREPGLPGGPPGVPRGARFDPYGPPCVPGFEPGRFGRYVRTPWREEPKMFEGSSLEMLCRRPRRPGGGTHPDL